MATIIAKYRFDNEAAYSAAKERIESEVGSYSYNGWDYSSSYYEIYIDDSCQKEETIGKICRAHGGKAYN